MSEGLVCTAKLAGLNIYCFKASNMYIVKVIGVSGNATVILTGDCRVVKSEGVGLTREELESIIIRVKRVLGEKGLLHSCGDLDEGV